MLKPMVACKSECCYAQRGAPREGRASPPTLFQAFIKNILKMFKVVEAGGSET